MPDALPPMSIERIAALKVEAAQLARSSGMRHPHALAELAKREGFRSWEQLVAQVGRSREIRRSIRALGLPTPMHPEGRSQR